MNKGFAVRILGSNSALPALGRYPTAQLLQHKTSLYLIDCGEGTQMRLKEFGISFTKINTIFISHLHGDHYFGLPGLLFSMHLFKRSQPLTIVGPPELENILNFQTEASKTQFEFPINFVANTLDSGTIYEDKYLCVETFTVDHTIRCNAFIFTEKQKERNLRAGVVEQYNIPYSKIPEIKQGENYTDNTGKVIPNEELTLPLERPARYAFITDTAFNPKFAKYIKEVDCLYHEATYLHEDMEKLQGYFHSSAQQAAMLAKEAKAKRLYIGHFSIRYTDLTELLTEARNVFENTELATDGLLFTVP